MTDIKPPMTLLSDAFHFFQRGKQQLFDKRSPKQPLFELKSRFDLLDHLQDTLSMFKPKTLGVGQQLIPMTLD